MEIYRTVFFKFLVYNTAEWPLFNEIKQYGTDELAAASGIIPTDKLPLSLWYQFLQQKGAQTAAGNFPLR